MSTWNLDGTSSVVLPDHRPRGRRMQILDDDGSLQRTAGTRRSGRKADLLRGKPEPRGREFWRLNM